MLTLIYGNNTYASIERLNEIISKHQGTVTTVDGEGITDVAEIFSHTDTFSMFTTRDLVIVKRFQNNRRKITLERKIVAKLQLIGVKDDFDLIFWEDHALGAATRKSVKKKLTKKQAKTTNISLVKFIKDNGIVENYTELKDLELLQWLNNKLTKAGITNASQYTRTIISKCGTNQAIVSSEADKLIISLKAEKRKMINNNDLELITRYEHTSMIWDLTDAISTRNKSLALSLIDKMLQKESDAPLIFAATLKQFKLLYLAKKYAKDTARVKKTLRVSDYPFTKALRYAQLFNIAQLEMLITKLVNLDFTIKQGKINSKLGLDLLIATLN